MENKWAEVANIFGLQLKEKFKINNSEEDYFFDEEGLWFIVDGKIIQEDFEIFLDLLKGNLTVIKKPWKPKKDEDYYYCSGVIGVLKTLWCDTNTNYYHWKVGNCFRTYKEAEIKGEEIMAQIKKEYEKA